MLQSFRDNIRGAAATVVVGLIIIPFAFFGVESIFVSGSSVDEAANVNGEKITKLELARGVELQKQKLLNQFQDIDPKLLDENRLQGPVLEQLIRHALLKQSAAGYGMAVADQTYNELVVADKNFQENGKFDKALFDYKLAQLGYTPLDYREAVKSDLLVNQLVAGVQFSSLVTQREMDAFSKLALQQRSFDYVALESKSVSDIEVSPDEIADYYEVNKEKFREPEKVVVDYIELDPQLIEAAVELSEQEIEERLKLLVQQSTPEKVWHLAHIMVSDAEASVDKLASVESGLAAGEDFASLAKAFSDDFGTAEMGGELPSFTTETLPEGFADVIASMAPGDISAPVKLPSGTHIIKLLDVSEEAAADTLVLRADAESQLRKENALTQLPAKLESLKEATFSAESLADAAREVGLEMKQSLPFSEEGGAGIARFPAVTKAAFGEEVYKDGFASEVLELEENHYVVVKMKEILPSHIPQREELQDQIAQVLKIQKAQSVMKTKGEEILAKIKAGGSLSDVAGELGQEVKSESGVTRFEQRLPAELIKALFDHTSAESLPVADMLVTLSGDVYVFSLKEINSDGVDALSDEERNAMRASLAQVDASRELLAYVEAMEAGAEVIKREIAVPESADE